MARAPLEGVGPFFGGKPITAVRTGIMNREIAKTEMIDQFVNVLIAATARIPGHYFQLPVAGREDPIYRERVYCYELYHQLRILLESDKRLAHYVLSGEVDKQGHPIIRRCAPDFVLHVPGEMNSNLVVMEVKPVNADLDGIRKDLETLSYFVKEVGYRLGIQLVYGSSETALGNFTAEFRKMNPPKLQLLWHRRPGEEATRIL